MKQFNLEKYLANPERRIVTRNGRPARILCTDRKYHDVGYPIVALVENDEDNESIESYTIDGNWWGKGLKRNLDLFFAPEKKVGWMNIYRTIDSDCPAVGDLIYTSEQAAKESISVKNDYYITTIKVEWEE